MLACLPGSQSKCVLTALLEHDLAETPAEPLKAYTGVDQIPSLNQGKVFPYVPIQTRGAKAAVAREEGRGGSEEPVEEGRKTEELPM